MFTFGIGKIVSAVSNFVASLNALSQTVDSISARLRQELVTEDARQLPMSRGEVIEQQSTTSTPAALPGVDDAADAAAQQPGKRSRKAS